MTQVKLFTRIDINELENEINSWLGVHKCLSVIDIKFSTVMVTPSISYYQAMIIYQK